MRAGRDDQRPQVERTLHWSSRTDSSGGHWIQMNSNTWRTSEVFSTTNGYRERMVMVKEVL